MKYIAFILSIIMLYLALMPCTDYLHTSCESMEYSINEESHDHDHSEEEEDGCSPLCVCQCCGSFITLPQATQLVEVYEQIDFSYTFHYSFTYNFDFVKGVWYPPTYC